MSPRFPFPVWLGVLVLLLPAGDPGALAAQDKKKAENEPVKVDEKAGTVSFGARVAKQDVYAQTKGFLEFLITMPGGKEYESVFIAPIDPIALFEGMKKVGLKSGKEAHEDDNGKKVPPSGAKIRILVEWKDGDKDRREPAETFVLDVTTGKPMEQKPWVFTGSREGFIPQLEKSGLLVLQTKNLVSLYHNDGTVLVQPSLVAKDEHQFKANKSVLPKEGTKVNMVVEPVK